MFKSNLHKGQILLENHLYLFSSQREEGFQGIDSQMVQRLYQMGFVRLRCNFQICESTLDQNQQQNQRA